MEINPDNKCERIINYLIAVEDIPKQKWNLYEYRLRWTTDSDGNFASWQQQEPELLGDSIIFGFDLEKIDLMV